MSDQVLVKGKMKKRKSMKRYRARKRKDLMPPHLWFAKHKDELEVFVDCILAVVLLPLQKVSVKPLCPG